MRSPPSLHPTSHPRTSLSVRVSLPPPINSPLLPSAPPCWWCAPCIVPVHLLSPCGQARAAVVPPPPQLPPQFALGSNPRLPPSCTHPRNKLQCGVAGATAQREAAIRSQAEETGCTGSGSRAGTRERNEGATPTHPPTHVHMQKYKRLLGDGAGRVIRRGSGRIPSSGRGGGSGRIPSSGRGSGRSRGCARSRGSGSLRIGGFLQLGQHFQQLAWGRRATGQRRRVARECHPKFTESTAEQNAITTNAQKHRCGTYHGVRGSPKPPTDPRIQHE